MRSLRGTQVFDQSQYRRYSGRMEQAWESIGKAGKKNNASRRTEAEA